MSLEQYAGVTAGLSAGLPLERVLENEAVSPAHWDDAEEAWSDALAEDDPDDEDGGGLSAAFEARLAAAQDRYARRVSPLDESLDAWLDFVRAFGAADDQLALLGSLGLAPCDLTRLHRSWSARIADDPGLMLRAKTALSREPLPVPPLDVGPIVPTPQPDVPTPEAVAASRAESGAGDTIDDDDDEDEDDDEAPRPPRPALFAGLPEAPPAPARPAPRGGPGAPPPSGPISSSRLPAPPASGPVSSGRFAAAAPGAPSSGRFPAVEPGSTPSGRFPAVEPGSTPSGRFPAVEAGSSPRLGSAPRIDVAPPSVPSRPLTPEEEDRELLSFGRAPARAAHTEGGLTLAQYAALTAELAVFPGSRDAIHARYGLVTDAQQRAADGGWKTRLRSHPDEAAKLKTLYDDFLRYHSEQARLGLRR